MTLSSLLRISKCWPKISRVFDKDTLEYSACIAIATFFLNIENKNCNFPWFSECFTCCDFILLPDNSDKMEESMHYTSMQVSRLAMYLPQNAPFFLFSFARNSFFVSNLRACYICLIYERVAGVPSMYRCSGLRQFTNFFPFYFSLSLSLSLHYLNAYLFALMKILSYSIKVLNAQCLFSIG